MFEKKKDYLVCVDSDGCLLDNMELKHKECFVPATVNCWNLQGASKYVRETAEFVNLYSRMRGVNRFPAIVKTLELAYARPELKARGYVLPNLDPLRQWIASTPVLSASAIDEYCNEHKDCSHILSQAAMWSREVDANIAHIVRNIREFPYVKPSLERLGEFADIVVVSATPHEALVRELESLGLVRYMRFIFGQDYGTKSSCIGAAMSLGYSPDHVLKIGDAPADYKAACDNGVLFNPIVAGMEEASWKTLLEIGADRFENGSFKGSYEDGLVSNFLDNLKDKPWWL